MFESLMSSMSISSCVCKNAYLFHFNEFYYIASVQIFKILYELDIARNSLPIFFNEITFKVYMFMVQTDAIIHVLKYICISSDLTLLKLYT